jgi:nitrogenase molybdenum-iron protein alpha/beta subunit
MKTFLFLQHEIDYIKENTQKKHLVEDAYVPKEIITDTGNRYIFYLRDGKLTVLSKQVDKSKCAIGEGGWTMQ